MKPAKDEPIRIGGRALSTVEIGMRAAKPIVLEPHEVPALRVGSEIDQLHNELQMERAAVAVMMGGWFDKLRHRIPAEFASKGFAGAPWSEVVIAYIDHLEKQLKLDAGPLPGARLRNVRAVALPITGPRYRGTFALGRALASIEGVRLNGFLLERDDDLRDPVSSKAWRLVDLSTGEIEIALGAFEAYGRGSQGFENVIIGDITVAAGAPGVVPARSMQAEDIGLPEARAVAHLIGRWPTAEEMKPPAHRLVSVVTALPTGRGAPVAHGREPRTFPAMALGGNVMSDADVHRLAAEGDPR